MNLNEAALLCGIQMRPVLKSDEFVIERSEVENLTEALEHLLEEGYVRYEDIDQGAVIDTLNSIRPESVFLNIEALIRELGGVQLFSYIPTEKGLAVVTEFEHLKQYVMYPVLPKGMTLEKYQHDYEKEEEKFKREFIKKYFAKLKKK